MKMFLFSVLTLIASVFAVIQNAAASCDVGPVLFRDTLYGTAVGTGVGALILLSSSSSTNIAPTLATSALVGAGAGLVVGVVEISMSNCSMGGGGRKDSENYGLTLKPMVSIVDNNQVTENNSKVPSIQQSHEDFTIHNNYAGGVTLEYQLN